MSEGLELTGRPHDGPPFDAVPIDYHQRPLPALLRAVLGEASLWLLTVEQPSDAIVPPEGYVVPVGEHRQLTISPCGLRDCVTVSIERLPRYLPAGPAARGAAVARRTDNPLAPLELRDLALELVRFGLRAHELVDGFPLHTGTVLLGVPVHPTLADAVDRHRAGCLDHPVINGVSGAPGCISCGCGWDRRGRERAVLPAGARFTRDDPRGR